MRDHTATCHAVDAIHHESLRGTHRSIFLPQRKKKYLENSARERGATLRKHFLQGLLALKDKSNSSSRPGLLKESETDPEGGHVQSPTGQAELNRISALPSAPPRGPPRWLLPARHLAAILAGVLENLRSGQRMRMISYRHCQNKFLELRRVTPRIFQIPQQAIGACLK